MVGGYCSTFRRGAFTFDAATHFYPLLGNPMTITGAVLGKLGSRTRWLKMDPVDHFHFPDGSSFLGVRGFRRVRRRAQGHVSARRRRARSVLREGSRSLPVRPPLLLPRAPARTARAAAPAHAARGPRSRVLAIPSCGSCWPPTARTGDRRRRARHSSSTRCSACRTSSATTTPKAGRRRSRTTSRASCRTRAATSSCAPWSSASSSNKVRRSASTSATGLGAARHLVRVNARHIVSNADLTLTLEKLLGPAVVGEAAMRAVRALRPSSPCFLVHLGLRDISLAELEPAAGYHWSSWNAEDVVCDAFKVFVPTMYEPRMAPPGGQVVILQRIMEIGYDRVVDWAGAQGASRGRPHGAPRSGHARRVGAHRARQSASALTSWRFTLNLHGAMLGWEMSPGPVGRQAARPSRARSATSIFPATGPARREASRRSSCPPMDVAGAHFRDGYPAAGSFPELAIGGPSLCQTIPPSSANREQMMPDVEPDS